MKIKISDLTNKQLNYAVALCEGWEQDTRLHPSYLTKRNEIGVCIAEHIDNINYSTDPSFSWPIIERECISIKAYAAEPVYWKAGMFGSFSGPTSLIAAMRAYVASVLGEYVDIPEGL